MTATIVAVFAGVNLGARHSVATVALLTATVVLKEPLDVPSSVVSSPGNINWKVACYDVTLPGALAQTNIPVNPIETDWGVICQHCFDNNNIADKQQAYRLKLGFLTFRFRHLA